MARPLLAVVAMVLVLAAAGAHGFRIEEASVASIQLGFNNGSLTSVDLVRFYLDRIRGLNPLLRPVIECVTAGGPLDGIPVLLKDNIATRDALNTTARSFALLGSVARRDAGVVRRLRRAGAVVLGKTNMDEWANFRSLAGIDGWSARGGQARAGGGEGERGTGLLF
ncbi:probable amidase At4g34880 [Aegilops tauschii subsp. strangulata]|uniref:probable amidase At4g34880 n=1 Tax=Aegilops tauschii subsp. strangulata TaxID=200361 RepID=UPI00098ABC90|nr:probable amidase At4g34880 [Aegilops tauschii subsp. strangulata]